MTQHNLIMFLMFVLILLMNRRVRYLESIVLNDQVHNFLWAMTGDNVKITVVEGNQDKPQKKNAA